MTLSSDQFHTLYDGAAQPVILVRDGAVAELNCHAQELFAVGTALRAYLPQDAALPEMLYARPAVLPVMAGGVCVSANTQPLDDALLLFLPIKKRWPELLPKDFWQDLGKILAASLLMGEMLESRSYIGAVILAVVVAAVCIVCFIKRNALMSLADVYYERLNKKNK